MEVLNILSIRRAYKIILSVLLYERRHMCSWWSLNVLFNLIKIKFIMLEFRGKYLAIFIFRLLCNNFCRLRIILRFFYSLRLIYLFLLIPIKTLRKKKNSIYHRKRKVQTNYDIAFVLMRIMSVYEKSLRFHWKY